MCSAGSDWSYVASPKAPQNHFAYHSRNPRQTVRGVARGKLTPAHGLESRYMASRSTKHIGAQIRSADSPRTWGRSASQTEHTRVSSRSGGNRNGSTYAMHRILPLVIKPHHGIGYKALRDTPAGTSNREKINLWAPHRVSTHCISLVFASAVGPSIQDSL